MATPYMVIRGFSSAMPSGVQTFRPGDIVNDDDPNFARIQDASPRPGIMPAAWFSDIPPVVLSMRLRATPDDVIQDFIQSQIIWDWD